MKKLILFTLLCLPALVNAQPLRCIKSSSYSKVVNGGNIIAVNKPAVLCFNEHYFSFYTPEVGTRTFRIDANRVDTLKGGYVRQRFINDENSTNTRGDYSVEVNYEKTKTVLISFTRFGEAYIIQAPKFLGSMEDCVVGKSTWKQEITKAATDTPKAQPGSVILSRPAPNNADPKRLAEIIRKKIDIKSQFIGNFKVSFDTEGIITDISPEHPLPTRYDTELSAIRKAAAGIKIDPALVDGKKSPSYTFVTINLK